MTSVPDEYQTLEVLARNASPGPWTAHDWKDYSGEHPFWFVDLLDRPAEYYRSDTELSIVPKHFDEQHAENDIKYIVAANPVVILDMINRIRRLKRTLTITWSISAILIVVLSTLLHLN